MTELKPFQHEGCRGIYKFRGRALLADEMGLGKTVQALYWVLKTPKHRPVVIVTPASMKYTWQAEAAHHFGMRAEILEGRRPKRMMMLPGEIVVINYDILHSWLPCLLKANPATIIFDECHALKSPKAKRTKAAVKLAQDANSIVGLSGTPITNRPSEFWSILNILRPDVFDNAGDFAWEFCKPRWTPWGWKFDGAANTKRLHRLLLRTCMIRRLKKDVLQELPSKGRRVISFRLNEKAQAEYDRAENSFLSWLKEKSPSRHASARKSPALTKVGYLLRLVAEHKMRSTVQWLEDFIENHPGEKLVALTMHTAVIEKLKARFPNCSVVIDGSVTGKKRHLAVQAFQNNRKIRFMFGNWLAAGIGLTLHAARYAVGLDFPWTPGHMLQGEDRIYRIGQKRNVVVFYLVTLGTIEEKLMRVLRKKASVLDAVLDGKEEGSSLNIFDELLAELKKK